MSAVRNVYKVVRSVLFSAVMVVLGTIALAYLLISIPAVQNKIREKAESELSSFLKGKVEIGNIDILPFNELRLHNVKIFTPDSQQCIFAERIAGGINLWELLISGRIVVGYAEIISMDAAIWQDKKDAPLNIQFIIDALAPKDKTKPPTQFSVVLHNIVIRKSTLSFDRNWQKKNPNPGMIDLNHLKLSNLRADVEIPQLKNDDFIIDIRRLAFSEKSGFTLRSLSVITHITPQMISVKNFRLRLPESEIILADTELNFDGYNNIFETIKTRPHLIELQASPFIPSELSAFYTPISSFKEKFNIKLIASGDFSKLQIDDLTIRSSSNSLNLHLRAKASDFLTPQRLSATIDAFELKANEEIMGKVTALVPNMKTNPTITRIVNSINNIDCILSGNIDMKTGKSAVTTNIKSGIGNIEADGDFLWNHDFLTIQKIMAKSESFNVASILPELGIGDVSINLDGQAKIALKNPANSEGRIKIDIPKIEYKGEIIDKIAIDAEKYNGEVWVKLDVSDQLASLHADANCKINGIDSFWKLSADVAEFHPSIASLMPGNPNACFSGNLDIDARGNDISNIVGSASLNNFNYSTGTRLMHVDNVNIISDILDGIRNYHIDTDFFTGNISGRFQPKHVIASIKNQIASTIPVFVSQNVNSHGDDSEYFDFKFLIEPNSELFEAIGSKFKPGVAVNIDGRFTNSSEGTTVRISAPYLIQGKNKLIKNTAVSMTVSEADGLKLDCVTEYPMKKDMANLQIKAGMKNNSAIAGVAWTMEENPSNNGKIDLGVNITKNPLTGKIGILANIEESKFHLNSAEWKVSPAQVQFSDGKLNLEGVHVAHNDQYIDINGAASSNSADQIAVELADVDLDYIFSILNINYVNFGGMATGKVLASQIFSPIPIAQTESLFVENFAYNDCVLGDAQMESHWNHLDKMVAINADISAKDGASAKVRGGVYVKRDSLSFDFDTRKLDIEFLKPFMSGFTSSVKGRATGNVKLFGTFSDIDLAGWAYADTITMKVDHTNVNYSGSDTIFFKHNKILIPHIKLYDKYGNSCTLKGEVRHRYLHDPQFDFELSNARNLLVYDTGPKFNPRWYGKVYGNGDAALRGRPGIVSLDINMQTADKSDFTFVLDETETAADYEFLTFTDSKKAAEEVIEKRELTFEELFHQKAAVTQLSKPDIFTMNLALDVTPGANMNIIMDPAAGDKIKARGNGGLRLQYESETDNFLMYGKYTLEQGTYNFSLQDLILKNFKIEPGSSISFNGDPMQGILDITAAYRVNTNLADLDRSFTNDPDLNRTNVPVDALLKVRGDINSPEIKFDLRLPTVTSEVERKVRSIISTEDMMNRQAIYLLALNRFYSPEYMQAEQNGGGGELASVASSTISSQISNIISALTDKFSLSPSFKSEKSDFSDMEVDVALSSSLFDNRLLINGNLGYRDKSTSQTTFIGDFDIEYLLSKDGKLRLKAYNHFNDASYYLKSALTTQGVGIIYRKDFDDPFTFIRKWIHPKKKKNTKKKNTQK